MTLRTEAIIITTLNKETKQNFRRRMTLPIERTNAVLNVERFLMDLRDPKKTPRVPTAVRQEAGRLLKHYPTKFDMEYMEERFEYKTGTYFSGEKI